MNNSQFFDKLAHRVLNECKTKQDFLDVNEELQRFMSENNIETEDMTFFTESGAAEVLAMISGSYKRRVDNEH